MDDDHLSELISQFVGVTDASPDKARQYLHISDNNLEQAIELFFNTGGIDLTESQSVSSQPPQAPPVPPPHTRPGAQNEVIGLDSDEEIYEDDEIEVTGSRPRAEDSTQQASTINPPSATRAAVQDDDEIMARRLQEELYAGGDIHGAVDAEGYRAPIARTRETLVGPGSYDARDTADVESLIQEQLQMRHRMRDRHAQPGIFNQRSSPSIWHESGENSRQSQAEMLARATGGASQSSSKSGLLAEMYRPPFEIMSRASWEDARTEGKESQKWILINVQDPSIFDCQILNRDLWKHEGIKETIKENFIFMQYAKDDQRGNQYFQYYFQDRENQESYPHIAIVDPRTGEQVKVWSGPPAPKAIDFLMQLHEFLDRYSLNAAAKNPVAKRKPEPKKETQVERMTEEEQLQMAMKASLAGTNDANHDDPDDLTRSVSDATYLQNADTQMTDLDNSLPNGHPTTSTPASTSPFASISSSNPQEEPPADASSTRIQFRHPNGRVVRRFALEDPIRRLYEWLKASPLEGKEGLEFELIAMGRNLIDGLDESVEAAGLKNGTVMVEFIEA